MSKYPADPENILSGLEKTYGHFEEETWPAPEIKSARIHILKDSDIEEEQEALEVVKQLIEEGYIELQEDGDIEDEETKLEKVKIEKFKQDIDYQEPFVLQEEDPDKIDIARYFAEWIAREREVVKTVKLDPSRNAKEIWHYDRESKIWKKGGEDKLQEILYDQIPEEHSDYLEKEVKTKVHRIDPITLEETGADPGKIAVANGILDPEEQELEEIKKHDYLSTKIPVEYELPAGTPEKFIEFLEDVTRSEEDMKKLQEFIGYCLMTDTAGYEKALMILGPTDSGKSVFLDVVRALLGEENIAQQPLQDLTNGRKWGLANLVGKIANIDHDLDPEAIEDIGTVKKITSGNPITVERKHQQPFDHTPTAKHIFSANRTPGREKEDDAFYNRWLTVVFPESIPREEQDPELRDKLTTEEELQGILNWAIAGYHRLNNQEQFTGEKGPYGTKEVWREWGSSVERFISKFLVTRRDRVREMKKSDEYDTEDIKDLDMKIHTETIYELYEKYAVGMDMEVKSKKALSSEIKKLRGVEPGKLRISGKQRRGFRNLELKENASKKIEEKIGQFQEFSY